MNDQVWGEITGLVGQGTVGEVISLLRLGIPICKMRLNSPCFTGTEGIVASVGAQQTSIPAIIIIVA